MEKVLTKMMLLLCVSMVSAQPNELWVRAYGGSGTERANSVVSTNDGGCVFAGTANSLNGNVSGLHTILGWTESDFWVVKLNAAGDIQWQKCLGGNMDEVAYDIIQVADGGFVIVGSAESNDGDITWHYGDYTFEDLWIAKIDNTGNLVWQKTYGGYSTEYATAVSETADGGIIVAAVLNADYNGTVPVTYSGSMDYWVLKLNALGEMQWNNHYGGENGDQARSIKGTADGGCIVVGQSGSHYGDVSNSYGPFNTSIPDYWIAKLNATGTIEWQKSFGGYQNDWATSVSLTNDGGYIIAGNTNSNNNGNVTGYHGGQDAWVVKISSLGNLEWQKSVGGTGADFFYSVVQTTDGGYFLCGSTNSSDGDLSGVVAGNKAWIVKLDSQGNISWQRHFVHHMYNGLTDIVHNPDGTCIAVGHFKYPATDQDYDAFVAKLDVSSLSNNEFDASDIILYPNAVDDILNIRALGEIINEIHIYDVQGKKVDSFLGENTSVNLNLLPKGVYFVELENDSNQRVRKKIVKN